MKFSSRARGIESSPIRKFVPYAKAATAAGKHVYHLNIGQPDIETPPTYFDAVGKFDGKVLVYADSKGDPDLLDGICKYYNRIGVNITEDDIFITVGGVEALQFALSSILDEDSELIVPEPFYPNYNNLVKIMGGRIIPFHTDAEEGFRFHGKAEIEKLITEKTRGFLVSTPGNPTGAVMTREDMKDLLDIAIKHDLFILADEVYREFIYDGQEMLSFGQFEDGKDNVVIIDSISKRFSACGARIGAVISRNEELQSHLLKRCQDRLSAPELDMKGAAALYRMPPDYFNETRDEYRRRRNIIMDKLAQIPGVICRKPAGAFYVFVTLPIEDAEDFLVFLLRDFDVDGETMMFAPGRGFYATPGKGRNTLRLAYVLECEKLEKAMNIFAKGLAAYMEKTGQTL